MLEEFLPLNPRELLVEETLDADLAYIQNDELRELSKDLPIQVQIPEVIKSIERSMEKTFNDYKGNYSMIVDLSRASVVCKDEIELKKVIQRVCKLVESGHFHIERVKNRFLEPTPNQYCDILLNMTLPRCPGGDACTKHVCELQLHIESFHKIKNGKGHKLYELVRALGLFEKD